VSVGYLVQTSNNLIRILNLPEYCLLKNKIRRGFYEYAYLKEAAAWRKTGILFGSIYGQPVTGWDGRKAPWTRRTMSGAI
jgi:hypothetical protein